VFVSFADRDKPEGLQGAKKLFDAGYELFATSGTAKALQDQGISVNVVRKFSEGKGKNGESTALDLIESGTVALVVNTPFGSGPREDGWRIRTSAVARGIPIITTISGLNAAAEAMVAQRSGNFAVTSLQEWLQ
jgi:carbamoyl-phosphate synthase large subunit